MARAINRLSARTVASLKAPGRHADGAGLYLVIDKAGAKKWVFIFRFDGRRREMGLGALAAVSLAAARERAAAARASVADGTDPIQARQRPTIAAVAPPTFADIANAFLADNEPGWKNRAHRRQWRQTMEDHAANLWNMPVAEVDTVHVLAALRPIWQTNSETARRLRGRLERVLDAAIAQGMRSGVNPARWKGHLSAVLPRVAKLQRGHHAAMPYADVPAFYAELCTRRAPAALALRIIILTAARSGEVRGMVAKEVNLSEGLWIVTAARMKSGRLHRKPLSAPACDLLRSCLPSDPARLVFPALCGRPMSDMVFGALLKRMGRGGVTAHGFRSSFRDWVDAETDFPGDLAEAALAHLVGSETERAYRRGDALDKRRHLMDAWARFVASVG